MFNKILEKIFDKILPILLGMILGSATVIFAASSSISPANLFTILGTKIVPNYSSWSINIPLSQPTNVAAVSTAGSVKANSPLYFEITATNGTGTTTASSEIATTTNSTGTQGFVISWTAVPGATNYFVNFGTTTPGSENAYFLATTTNQYTFTSTSTPVAYGPVPGSPSSFAVQIGNGINPISVNGVSDSIISTTTPLIGGNSLVAGVCDYATSTFAVGTLSSTTAVITTPQKDPGHGVTWGSIVYSSSSIVTEVCAEATLSPVSTIYNIKAF